MAERYEIEIVPKQTTEAVNAIAKMYEAGIKKTAGAVSGLFPKSMPGAGDAVGKAGGAVAGMAGGAVGLMTGAVKGPLAALDAIQGIVNGIAEAVNAFDPNVIEMFNIAMKDAMAAVGQALVPVFQILTPLVRTLGDYIASVLDQDMMQQIVDAVKPLLDVFAKFAAALAPLAKMLLGLSVDVLTIALEVLAAVVDYVADAFLKTMGVFSKGIAEFLYYLDWTIPGGPIGDEWIERLEKAGDKMLQGTSGNAEFDKSARGLGGMQPKTGIAIGDLNKDLIMKALSSGASSPQERTAKSSEEIAKNTKLMAEKMLAGQAGGFMAPAMAQP